MCIRPSKLAAGLFTRRMGADAVAANNDWQQVKAEDIPRLFSEDGMEKMDELQVPGAFDLSTTKPEAFADHFEHPATTKEQRNVAALSNVCVEETIPAIISTDERERFGPAQGVKAYCELHGHETLSGLFAEIRADEAAAKREDAHWYGKITLQDLRNEKTKTQAAENDKDRGNDR